MCIHIVHMTILYPWVYILIDETAAAAAAVYNFYMMGVVVALVSALGYYPVCVWCVFLSFPGPLIVLCPQNSGDHIEPADDNIDHIYMLGAVRTGHSSSF